MSKRYFFADEEPELDYPWSDEGYRQTQDLCGRCGSREHRYESGRSECPNFPLMIRRSP